MQRQGPPFRLFTCFLLEKRKVKRHNEFLLFQHEGDLHG